MGNLKTKLFHLKVRLFGDKELEKSGKMIPCRKCNISFKSYYHYDTLLGFGYVYDSLCDKCDKESRR